MKLETLWREGLGSITKKVINTFLGGLLIFVLVGCSTIAKSTGSPEAPNERYHVIYDRNR